MIKRSIRWLDINLESFICSTLFLLMLVLITSQIILRNIFSAGTAWGEEMTRYIFVWSSYIGLSYATRNNTHITIDAVRRKLPEKAQKIVLLIVEIIILAIFVRLFIGTVNNCMNIAKYNGRALSLNISSNWLYLSGPVAFGLGIVRAVQNIFWKIKHLNSSFTLYANAEGVYSGSLENFTYTEEVKQELMSGIDLEVVRELEEFKAKHKKGV